MPVLSILSIGLIGWLIVRLLHPKTLELSPASLPLIWILGTGGIYLLYYLHISILQQNPSPVLILGLGGLGGFEAIRHRHQVTWVGWHPFKQAKWVTLILCFIVVVMSISIFMSGFYADTTRMWLAKGDMLNQLPDYGHLLESLKERLHPDYPMVMSHQYQWQLVWSDSLISLKLLTWVWYIMLLLACLDLFTRWTKHPIRWLILLAGYPSYWFVMPIATVDIPISVMWVTAIVWMMCYLEDRQVSVLGIALVCGVMILTKNEGFITIGCILFGLMVTAFQQPMKRQQIIRLMIAIGMMSCLCFISWYGLIVGQAIIAVGSDFSLSGFRLERVPEVAKFILPILFNPLETAWLWIVFLGFLIVGYRDNPLLWLPVLVYLLAISVSYTFSVRPTTLYQHIVQSYFRLILQIAPLALVYVARCFSFIH
jgi:hypothetical protein